DDRRGLHWGVLGHVRGGAGGDARGGPEPMAVAPPHPDRRDRRGFEPAGPAAGAPVIAGPATPASGPSAEARRGLPAGLLLAGRALRGRACRADSDRRWRRACRPPGKEPRPLGRATLWLPQPYPRP